MFDISFGELLICAVIALLVLGPERLPTAARTIGRWVGRARHTVSHFTEQIDREMRAEDLKRRIDEEIRKSGVNDIARQVNEALHAPLKLPDEIPAPEPVEPAATTAVAENSIAAPAIDAVADTRSANTPEAPSAKPTGPA
jgi:sec-independent protein translocase protein TatB